MTGNNNQTGGSIFGGNNNMGNNMGNNNMGGNMMGGTLFGGNTGTTGNSMFNKPSQPLVGTGFQQQQGVQNTGNQIVNEYLAFQNSL